MEYLANKKKKVKNFVSHLIFMIAGGGRSYFQMELMW